MPTKEIQAQPAAISETSPLLLLAAAAAEDYQNAGQDKISPKQSPTAAAAPPPKRARAEQRRREALEESLTDYLPIENLRAVERMNEQELTESKNLVMCFLSGRGAETGDEHNIMRDTKEAEDSRYVNNFQSDMNNFSHAYHYTYDPSLPFPKSPPPPLEKKGSQEEEKTKRSKNKHQEKKSKNEYDENLLCKIEGHPLLLACPQPTTESNEHETEDDGICEPQQTLISNVPSIVRVKSNNVLAGNQECVLDESVHSSSVVVDEASVLTSNPTSYSFEWDEKQKGWRCKRCCAVNPSFRAADAFISGSEEPNPRLMHSHKHACLGTKADLTKAVEIVLNLTKTTAMEFKHIKSPEFQQIVQLTVNGKEEYVTLFTTDLRNRWLDPVKYKIPSANINWGQHPVKAPMTETGEKLIAAMVAFSRKMGLGFDFVANEHFVELFKMISPGCFLPTPDDLISYW